MKKQVRNSVASKERILDAALSEFAEYGIAGARVERISKAAGCNKNLIYIYFESKEKLFTTVLETHLARVYEDGGPLEVDDLPGYAVRVFDFAMSHPDLMRLMAWHSLEQKVGNLGIRTATRDSKFAAVRKAQRSGQLGDALAPDFLLTAIMSLATAWTAINPFGSLYVPEPQQHLATLRKGVVEAIQLLSNGQKS